MDSFILTLESEDLVEWLRIISLWVKLLYFLRVLGGAAHEIILGCQAFGLLSEQWVAKNSSQGWEVHTERGAEGARGNAGAATKMASKGEMLWMWK